MCGLQNVKKRFHVISIAKTWFFRAFRCKIIDFQILVASSRCPKNRKNLKIDILPQKYRECSGDAFFFVRKMFWTLESVFLIIFRQPLGAFWRKNKKFYVFLMFFDDFTRSQLFGSVHWPCMGVEGSKKIKIAKNHFKHP